MSPTRYRVWDGSVLVGTGGNAVIGPVPVDNTLTRAQRAALVPLTYIPNKKTNGLLPGYTAKSLTPVYPTAGQTSITLQAGVTYRDKLFWGEVVIPRGAATGPTIENCWMAGQDPRTILNGGADESRCIRAYDNDVPHWTMRDSVVSMLPWTDATLNPPGGPVAMSDWIIWTRSSIGVKGGNFTIDSVELTGTQDGIQYQNTVLYTESAGVPVNGYSQLIKTWIHGMTFYRGPAHVQPEGTHSDCLQIMLGGHLTVTGGLLGGAYDPTGYLAYPGYNSGDDSANSELMFKQENWNFSGTKDDRRVVDYMDFDRVIFMGASRNAVDGGPNYLVNNPYNATYPNTFPNSSLHDCLFNDLTDLGSKYVTRTSTLAGIYSNNRKFTLDADGNIVVGGAINYTNG